MLNDARIRERLQVLLQHVEPERREHARRHLERLGWLPISELVHSHDPRWTELVPAERESAVEVRRRLLRFGGDDATVSDDCLLIEDGGRRARITSLDEALSLLDGSPAPFVISYGGAVYYDAGGSDPSQFFVRPDGSRSYVATIDWGAAMGAAFRTLAARNSRLLRAFGEVFIEPPLTERGWRELWRRSVLGSFWKRGEGGIASYLWLEFADAPVVRLGAGDAGGFPDSQFDGQSPSPFEPADPYAEDWVVELTALPPFADLVGTHLQGIELLAWADDPHAYPLDIRLQFERGDVWIGGSLRDTHVYCRRPRYWDWKRYEVLGWQHPT